MIRVFISSVSKGLEDVRGQIIEDLHTGRYGVIGMEAFGARPEAPLEVCLRELGDADVVVVIIGPRYGSIVPAGDVSYTHEEFREARRRGIPVLAFRIPDQEELSEDETNGLNELSQEAGSALTYQPSSLDRLSGQIQASLTAARDRGELGLSYKLFQPFDRFFASQLSEDNPPLFNHLGPFLGRQEHLNRIVEFMTGSERLLLLKATGGAGKSRILLEAAKAVGDASSDPPNPSVLFVDSGAQWQTEDVNSLPTTPTVLVFDDAHRRPDLDRLIAACLQRNEDMRFIVSCRPSVVSIVDPHIAQLISGSPPELSLPPLPKSDAQSLAEHYLGQELAHLAERLVKVADANPLVISIGGQCVKEELIAPEFLERTPEAFRRVVLDKLLDDHSLHDSCCKSALEVVAAIGPIGTENRELNTRIAGFFGAQDHDLVRALGSLEKAGFLQRRGRLLRVSPDVLADHVLHRASVSESGRPTGFIDKVIATFTPEFLGNILANAAELDWRGAEDSPQERVLAATWNAIAESLDGLTNREREQLVKELRRAAVFAPGEVMTIAERLVAKADAPKDTQLEEYGLEDRPSRVTDALSGLLGFIASNPAFTERCLRPLWSYAIDDERPANPRPEHPRRRIEHLLKYNRYTEEAVQLQGIDFLVSRLCDDSDRPDAPWAIEALGSVLAREGEAHSSTKRTFTRGSFSLAPHIDRIRERRDSVIMCLVALANSTRMGEAVQAIRQLGELLERPRRSFGQQVDDEEAQLWVPESAVAAARLAELGSSAESNIIRFLARRELREARPDHWPGLASALKSAFESIPTIPGEELFDIIIGIPWAEQLDDWEKEQERVRERCRAAAADFWTEHKEVGKVVAELINARSLLSEVTHTGDSGLWSLVKALVEARPADGVAFVQALANAGLDDASEMVPAALTAVLEYVGREEVARLIREMTSSPNENLRAQVASSLVFLIDQNSATLDDLELLRPFACDHSFRVRRAAAHPLLRFRNAHAEQALEVLVSIDWDDEPSVGEAVCRSLHSGHALDREQLTDEQIDKLIERIKGLPSLGRGIHNVMQIVEFASHRRPEQTTQMLLDRLLSVDQERSEEEEDRYTPLPYSSRDLPLSGLQNSTNYTDLLRMICNASRGASMMVRFWLPHLFHAAATDVDVGLVVLRELFASGNENDVINAAHLLQGFDHSVVFSLHEFLADLLDAAAEISDDCLQHTKSELFGLAISGIYSGSPGQPAPRHINTRNEAQMLVERYRDRAPIRSFYEGLVNHAVDSIKSELLDWETEGDDE